MQKNTKTDTRRIQLEQWLQSAPLHALVPGPFSLEPASADASFRRYFRVNHAKGTMIAADAPPDKEDNPSFIRVAKRLQAAGVHVPSLFAQNLQKGFLLMSDLGNTTYLQALNEVSADHLYHQAMDTLVTIQTQTPSQELPLYSGELLHKEMYLFQEWFLEKHLNLTLSRQDNATLVKTFEFLKESALQQPCFFVHRDYHSRNIMVMPHNNPGILDFQDAVHGPVSYDLASLLKDCYIDWPKERTNGWITYYIRQLESSGGPALQHNQFIMWFDLMAAQRHLKAIGIFARLHLRDRKPDYLNDIPRVLRYLFDTCHRYKPLEDFLTLLRKHACEQYDPSVFTPKQRQPLSI
ncbi:MAG: phosphotransferase [Gammaproteobacteria bacterium]|nr:phosphotransferase [Gammaproteobacteria bacterium]